MKAVVWAIGAWLWVVVGLAQAQDGAAADKPSVGQGRTLYTSFCARCHGVNMVNTGVSFDLRTFPREQPERFQQSVRQGLRAMPAWGDRFSAGELESIWLYVKSGGKL